MSDDVVIVGSYSDVLGHDDLSSKDELAVIDELNVARDSDLVVWVRDWLPSKKALEAAGSSDQVFVGRLERKSDDAWLLAQPDGTEDWIPKSQGVAFERAPDATLSTPQQRPDDQGGAV